VTAALARVLGMALLRRARGGTIEIVEGSHREAVGGGGDLQATVEIHDADAFWPALLHGGLGLGTAYLQGAWDSEDLVALVRMAALSMTPLDRWRARLGPAVQPVSRAARRARPNTRTRNHEQIATHYDLSDELFALMLDDTLTYSCAVFERPQATLREAQEAKLERVCRKLALGPDDHVVEIGTGWGSFAVHAARRHGCRVTTATVSEAQHARAAERVRAAGLADRINVVHSDYRDLRGRFDKLVSIEMIEAVGAERLPAFFERCGALLHERGAMLLQAITTSHRIHRSERNASETFIGRYIFPGGSLPSLQAMVRALDAHTDLRVVGLEDLSAHYGETLRRWRVNVEAAADRVRALGFDERFRRMWRFYLAFCEGGFRERRIHDVQVLLAKPGWRGEAIAPLGALPVPEP
jgi:cyclopropane-fatty-acyl-phospholipid synthase